MQITYLVNRVSRHPRSVEATFQGEAAQVVIDELEVELVDTANRHGSITFRFTKPSEIAWALTQFAQGHPYTLNLADVAA